MSVLTDDQDPDVRAFFNPNQPPSNSEFYDSDGEPIGDVSVSPRKLTQNKDAIFKIVLFLFAEFAGVGERESPDRFILIKSAYYFLHPLGNKGTTPLDLPIFRPQYFSTLYFSSFMFYPRNSLLLHRETPHDDGI